MRKNRFVLDNNVWISYFIAKRQQIIIDIATKNHINIFACDELIEEFKEVLQYPHLKKYSTNIKEAVKIIKDITVPFTLTYPLKRYIPADADDDYVIALALQTNSGFVTSGDNDILDEKQNLEKKYSRLKIITKAEFESKFTI